MIRLTAIAALALISTSSLGQVAAPPAVEAAPTVRMAQTATTTTRPAKLPRDIHWVRDSAEYRASAIQAYRVAARQLDIATKDLTSGTWAVVLDADETVLDNSQYQKELAEKDTSHSSALWKAWCQRVEATAVPGVIAFLKHVHQLGGRIAIVTNRSTDEQAATEQNFKKEGIPYDLMLCRSGKGEKEQRSQAIEQGTAAPGVPPLKIVMWVGDNIQDFPGQRQELRTQNEDAFSDFGSKYVILPNPMYGSWERNPER